MTSSNCHFTWLKQKETMISLSQSLFKDPAYFDCQLCADGHHFNVHRVILSCNSPVLSNILQEHEVENPVITLDGVSPLELGALVEFMYTGVTRISPDLLANFFQTAKSLQLAGLSHYDDLQNDRFLGDDVSTTPEESVEFQEAYEGYNQNILKFVDCQVEMDDSENKVLEAVNTTDSNFFCNDRLIERNESIDDDSGEYDKYQDIFIKEEDVDNTLSSATNEEGNSEKTCLADDSNEKNVPCVPFSKIHSVLLNENNDGENEEFIDQSVKTVYSVCKEEDTDMKEGQYLTVEDNIQVAEEDENYVFVNIDSSVFHRMKDGNLSRVKQKKTEGEFCMYSDKYLKVLNPVKKNFLLKRPKIQNTVGKDLKADPEDKKIYICLKCGNKYSHRRTLLHHIHWICEQPATYSCSLCPYMGKRKFQLKSHMKHAHMLRMC